MMAGHVEDYVEFWMQYRIAVDSDSEHQYKKLPTHAKKTKGKRLLEAASDKMAVKPKETNEWEVVEEVTDEEWEEIAVDETQAERTTATETS